MGSGRGKKISVLRDVGVEFRSCGPDVTSCINTMLGESHKWPGFHLPFK